MSFASSTLVLVGVAILAVVSGAEQTKKASTPAVTKTATTKEKPASDLETDSSLGLGYGLYGNGGVYGLYAGGQGLYAGGHGLYAGGHGLYAGGHGHYASGHGGPEGYGVVGANGVPVGYKIVGGYGPGGYGYRGIGGYRIIRYPYGLLNGGYRLIPVIVRGQGYIGHGHGYPVYYGYFGGHGQHPLAPYFN